MDKNSTYTALAQEIKLIEKWKADTRAAARRHGIHVNDYWSKHFEEIVRSNFARFP